jgi:hypothetical protein
MTEHGWHEHTARPLPRPIVSVVKGAFVLSLCLSGYCMSKMFASHCFTLHVGQVLFE